jgi:hypothetical protein
LFSANEGGPTPKARLTKRRSCFSTSCQSYPSAQKVLQTSKRGSATLASAAATWNNPKDPEFKSWQGFHGEASSFPARMGVQNDWIAVGPSLAAAAKVQIAAVDDKTNTITLASAISRKVGDHIWLHRDSDGTVVISGKAPDIGALEIP